MTATELVLKMEAEHSMQVSCESSRSPVTRATTTDLPGSAPAGSWSQKWEAGIELSYLHGEGAVLNSILTTKPNADPIRSFFFFLRK